MTRLYKMNQLKLFIDGQPSLDEKNIFLDKK